MSGEVGVSVQAPPLLPPSPASPAPLLEPLPLLLVVPLLLPLLVVPLLLPLLVVPLLLPPLLLLDPASFEPEELFEHATPQARAVPETTVSATEISFLDMNVHLSREMSGITPAPHVPECCAVPGAVGDRAAGLTVIGREP